MYYKVLTFIEARYNDNMALSSLLLPHVFLALWIGIRWRGKHEHVGDLLLPRSWRFGNWWWFWLLLLRHRFLLRLLELVKGAQQVDLLPLDSWRDRLRAALQEVQRLARLLCIVKERVSLLPRALKSWTRKSKTEAT